MIDWHSWVVRFRGRTLEVDLDSALVDDLERLGWVRRRLGQYCLTAVGREALRRAHDHLIARELRTARRYEEALRRIAAEYPGARDYPGEIARRALEDPDHTARKALADALRCTPYPVEEDR